MDPNYDVVVIGCGCVGAYAAMYLSKYNLKLAMIESAPEPAFGTTKANSGIVHASHNTEENTLKYTMVDEGNRRIREFSKVLNYGYTNCGEIVVAENEGQLEALKKMYEKAIKAGLKAELLNKEELQQREPNVTALAGIFVPEGGVVNPYEMTIAVYNTAVKNGCDSYFNCKVIQILRGDCFTIVCESGQKITTRFVVNAAGIYSDSIAKMVDPLSPIKINPRKGEEYLLDKDCCGLVNSVIFPLPDGKSKGILVIPTVDGTIMVGPTADDVLDKETKATSEVGMEKIFFTAGKLVKGLNPNMVIASFTGLRSVEEKGDFILDCKDNFINIAGIQSPGMTASPVLGEKGANFVIDIMHPTLKSEFVYAPLSIKFAKGNKKELVQEDGNHSKIVCGCEMVTEADIENSITEGARTLDGVKARTRAGMGRCEGGFCTGRIVKILSNRLNVEEVKICKRGLGTELSIEEIDGKPAAKAQRDIEDILPYTPENVDKTKVCLLASEEKKFDALKDETPEIDVLIIGAGPSGLAAGQAAAEKLTSETVLILEKADRTGGVLTECIHSGFGLKKYEKELTGPEYAEILTDEVIKSGCGILLNSYVTSVEPLKNNTFRVSCVTEGLGYRDIVCKQLISANGCRERSRENIKIAGTRPAGVYTAGLAQALINIEGQLPGKNIVILGSGDIGLIMARRCTLEGGRVIGVYELLPRCSGLERNVAECLEDFNIPLHLSETVVEITGNDRVESVYIAPVDPETLEPDLSKKYQVKCDCLLLSVGLIPEVKIALQAGAKISQKSRLLEVDSEREICDNAFAAGNCLQVHDLADDAAVEGELAGKAAAHSLMSRTADLEKYTINKCDEIAFCIPDYVYAQVENEKISMRIKKPLGQIVVKAFCGDEEIGRELVEEAVPAEMIHIQLGEVVSNIDLRIEEITTENASSSGNEKILTCIVCPRGCKIHVRTNDEGDIEDIFGNACKRGYDYAVEEHKEPFRQFSTTIAIANGCCDRLPVKLAKPIEKSKILEAVHEIKKLEVSAPIKMGEVIGKVEGSEVIACCSVRAEQ